MKFKSWFNRHPTLFIIQINFLILSIIIVLVELVLRLIIPFNILTIGHIYSENAIKYGWGYNPYELVRIADPDTREVYDSFTNRYGWRDIDHSFENAEGRYRILVLGDSNTFGAIVPADKIYTRVLEQKLQSAGVNAEVISLAYGGWGTDQQLEALVKEGLSYGPNLVILQFTTNDISDNQTVSGPAPEDCTKPFFYTIIDGKLRRNENQCFASRKDSLKDKIKWVISKSEILKRAYGLYLAKRLVDVHGGGYSVSENKIDNLKVAFGLDRESGFLDDLQQFSHSPNKSRIVRLIDDHHLGENKIGILRVLEDRWFNRYWKQSNFSPEAPKVDNPGWKLFFGLLLEISKQVENSGAKLAILSDNEIGHYDWDVYWFRVKNHQQTMENYLAPTGLIRQFATANGIDFIENRIGVTRARNDPHPNIQGNIDMARNILNYLKSNGLQSVDIDSER